MSVFVYSYLNYLMNFIHTGSGGLICLFIFISLVSVLFIDLNTAENYCRRNFSGSC